MPLALLHRQPQRRLRWQFAVGAAQINATVGRDQIGASVAIEVQHLYVNVGASHLRLEARELRFRFSVVEDVNATETAGDQRLFAVAIFEDSQLMAVGQVKPNDLELRQLAVGDEQGGGLSADEKIGDASLCGGENADFVRLRELR